MSEVSMGAAGRDGLGGETNPADRSVLAGGAVARGTASGADAYESWFRSGVSLLPEYGLLKVHGADAGTFLQAQLTNDVAGLVEGEVRLAGYCSAKGRLIGSFWVWRDSSQEAFWLACSRDIAPGIAKRLSMFVLRAKVKVEDLSDAMALLGFVTVGKDNPDGAVTRGWVVGAQPLPPVRLASAVVAAIDPALVETAADAVIGRALWPVATAAAEDTLQQLAGGGTPVLPVDSWRRLEVLSGTARINAGNQELFVPQMVNFELVGGVSFKKGCYPGQEVVARSQYLGKLKRRMFLGLGAGLPPDPGADVTRGAATAEPVGQVVLSAPLADGQRFVVLFESRLAAGTDQAQADGWRIGESDVSPLPLPYLIPPTADAPAARKATPAADGA